jgi:hypothetical protein
VLVELELAIVWNLDDAEESSASSIEIVTRCRLSAYFDGASIAVTVPLTLIMFWVDLTR